MTTRTQFSDSVRESDSVSIPSSWLSCKYDQVGATAQTNPVLFSEAGTGSDRKVDVSSQTFPPETQRFYDTLANDKAHLGPDQALVLFLRRVEAPVSDMLMENLTSSAFDGWPLASPLTDDEDRGLGGLSNLIQGDFITHPYIPPSLTLVAMDKSNAGSSLVLAFAVPHDHKSSTQLPWSTQSGHLCCILNGSPMDHLTFPGIPCALACHPDVPSLVAIGSWGGNVMVWDLNSLNGRPNPTSLITCPPDTLDLCHSDVVSDVQWIKGQMSTKAHEISCLWSISIDGTIIEWKFFHSISNPKPCPSQLVPLRKCMVSPSPYVQKVLSAPTSTFLGMPLSAFCTSTNSATDSCLLVIGSLAGHVIHLDTLRIPGADLMLPRNKTVGLPAPISPHFRYLPGNTCSTVAIKVHPYIPTLFASGGEGGDVYLYRFFKDTPIVKISLPQTIPRQFFLNMCWSPQRPSLLAITMTAQLTILDVTASASQPILASIKMICSGPITFHSSLPLIYVGVLDQGKSGVRVVRMDSTFNYGDTQARVKDMSMLSKLSAQ